ncbi:MAG TPA: FtsX-like permease family protein [Acidimicrobiales bacterium]|jgi:putative ABC transport system permease protein|nr:FtsX-like permease family protein [Acidimicrobiales bacterium]
MFRLTLKGLWAHKLRFALTGLAVVLGVAFMAGTRVLTDTMSRTFDGLFTTANDGIDVVVQQPVAVDGEFTEARERVPAAVVDDIRGVSGVSAAAGSVQGFSQLVLADGEVGAVEGFGATIGTNWLPEGLSPLQLASGRAPIGTREVVVDAATAADQGWVIGDTVTVLGKSGPRDFSLVGTARYGDVDGLPGASLVAVEDATAQEMFGEPGAYDSVVVTAAPGIASDTLAERIGTSLHGGGYEVLTGAQDTADKQAQMKEDLQFFNAFLMTFAYIALFVGMFIIYNTFSIVLAQRAKDLAMLRAIGASRRQVLRSVIGEAIGVGVVAAAVGLGLGVAMSFALKALLGGVGLDIPGGGMVVSTATIVTSLVVGLAVTLVSAIAPAWRASRVAPMAALRDSAVERTTTSVRRVLVGVGLTAAGGVTFAAGTVASGTEAVQLLGLGALTAILGLFVLGPVVARPVIRILGFPARRISGTAGRLARENARRNPKRTAATASALMVGVGLVGFITILASSTKASIADAVDRSFRGDFVVDSGAWEEGGFSPALAEELRALPEVASVAPLRSTPVGVDGGSTTLLALDTTAIDRHFDLDVSSGAITDVHDGGIAVRRDEAEDLGLAVGDTVTMTFARTGDVDLTVDAIFDERLVDSDWIVDLGTFETNVTDQYDRWVFVDTVDTVDAATANAALEAALGAWPNAELQDQASFKESITAEIDQLLNLIYGLLALAVVIALIGIANTLALSVHERRRELGLLRAIGMSRRQVRTSVRWEAVMISLLGTVLGGIVAVLGAWGIVHALQEEGIGTMIVPAAPLVTIGVLAGMAGVVAATGPARRAARADVLQAIAAE